MKLFLIAVLPLSALRADVDVRELVRKSLANYQYAYSSILNYTYTQHDVEHKSGSKTILVSEIVNLEGTPYERLISKNGQPLSASEQRKEEEQYKKTAEQRKSETPEQRHKRISDYQKQRSFLKEVPDAFHFKLLGMDTVNGRPAYLVECTPNPEYRPHNMGSHIFTEIHAKLWIDKQDLQWAKAEAHVMDTISFGVVLARVAKGAQITMEQTRINDRLWLPKRFDISGNARIMLVKTRDLTEEITFSNYRLAHPAETVPLTGATRLDNMTAAGR